MKTKFIQSPWTMSTAPTILLVLCSLANSLHVNAQQQAQPLKKMRIGVELLEPGRKFHQKLDHTTDSSVVIRIPFGEGGRTETNYALLEVPATRTNQITTYTNNTGGGTVKGALIGFGVGSFLGLLIMTGKSQNEIFLSTEEVALTTMLASIVVGTLVGAMAGGQVGVSIPIGGSVNSYRQNRRRIDAHAAFPSPDVAAERENIKSDGDKLNQPK